MKQLFQHKKAIAILENTGVCLLACFLFFMITTQGICTEIAQAARDPASSAKNDLPIRVSSDDMLYDMDKNTVDFKGNVIAIRGDFILKANIMTIYMLKEEDKSKQESVTVPQSTPLTGKREEAPTTVQEDNNIEKITASQGVTFKYGTQSGSSDSAVYQAKTGILTMYGNPIVRDGENQIQGETIRYYMNENRSEVVGTGNKRVEAIFKK